MNDDALDDIYGDENEFYEVVLINVTFTDAEHPKTDEIVFRYNDGANTYIQKFITAHDRIFSSMNEFQAAQVDPADKIVMQFIETAAEVDGKEIEQYALTSVSSVDAPTTIFYDYKECMKRFIEIFDLKPDSVFVLAETQSPQKEILKP